MPRTKRVHQEDISENIKPSTSTLVRDMVNTYLKNMKARETMRQINIQTKADQLTVKVHTTLNEEFLKYRQYNTKTMSELKNIFPKEPTMYDKTIKSITMNSTKGKTRKTRSVSVESRGRPSRAAASSIVKKQTRASRSLSRSKQPNLTNKFITPACKSANSYGMITPKIKPNTPQVLLRRPLQGEIAVSMKGSPLMVDHIANQKPNVNIPLLDGRVFSILPEKGLRTSELPDIDPHIRRQIQTLRDNLSQILSGNL